MRALSSVNPSRGLPRDIRGNRVTLGHTACVQHKSEFRLTSVAPERPYVETERKQPEERKQRVLLSMCGCFLGFLVLKAPATHSRCSQGPEQSSPAKRARMLRSTSGPGAWTAVPAQRGAFPLQSRKGCAQASSRGDPSPCSGGGGSSEWLLRTMIPTGLSGPRSNGPC